MTTATKQEQTGNGSELQTYSGRFLSKVEKEFGVIMSGELEFNQEQRRLAQHLFAKVDASLKTMEANRLSRNQRNKAEFAWKNVNMEKLALDTVHRVSLGLDALVPNHLHPIAYWNSKQEKYDIDLRIGYTGQDFIRRRLAVEPPLDVIYELVHETDHFQPLPRSSIREVEGYEFEITRPFDRGEVIGGFGYIMYDEPRKNRLVIVTPRDFDRARNSAQTKDFWDKNELEMKYKTLVHRVAAKVPLDPAKLNSAAVAEIGEDNFDRDREVIVEANRDLLTDGQQDETERDQEQDSPEEQQDSPTRSPQPDF